VNRPFLPAELSLAVPGAVANARKVPRAGFMVVFAFHAHAVAGVKKEGDIAGAELGEEGIDRLGHLPAAGIHHQSHSEAEFAQAGGDVAGIVCGIGEGLLPVCGTRLRARIGVMRRSGWLHRQPARRISQIARCISSPPDEHTPALPDEPP